jgi:hypothetical protein
MRPTIRLSGGTASQRPKRRRRGGVARWGHAEIAAVPSSRVVSAASSGLFTVKDATVTQSSSPVVATDYIISVTRDPNRPDASAPLPAIEVAESAAIELVGNVVRSLANGSPVLVRAGDSSLTVTPTVVSAPEQMAVWLDWVVGSLAFAMGADAMARIDGKDAATGKALYLGSAADWAAGLYTPNPDCWVADLLPQLSCEPLRVNNSNRLGGCLITPCHLYVARHVLPAPGTAYTFRGSDGSLHTRTVIRAYGAQAIASAPGRTPTVPDLGVALLSSDLPATVHRCPLAGLDLADHCPTLFSGNAYGIVPAIAMDQENKALLKWATRISPDITQYFMGLGGNYDMLWSEGFATTAGLVPSAAAPWNETLIDGDSSNPSFLLVDGQIALLGVHHTGYWDAFTGFYHSVGEIQRLIDACDASAGITTGYSPTTLDLSGYPTY